MDYAQFTLPHSSTRISPYEMLNGHLPYTSFDWQAPTEPMSATAELSQKRARELATHINKAIKKGKEVILKS